MRTATREANRDFLLDRFVGRLLGERPGSVLDVGCGRGDLVRRCGAAGVAALGLEGEAEHVEVLAAAGLDARQGRAEELPFEPASFDWVTLRHVPHHLDDPPRAVAEALRVARVGVLLAEPWYDRSIPAQDVGWGVDQWLRADDRRLGKVHGVGFSAAELADLVLRAEPRATLALETHLALAVEDPGALRAALDARLAAAGGEHPERAAIERLMDRAAETGVGLGGSASVLARVSWEA